MKKKYKGLLKEMIHLCHHVQLRVKVYH